MTATATRAAKAVKPAEVKPAVKPAGKPEAKAKKVGNAVDGVPGVPADTGYVRPRGRVAAAAAAATTNGALREAPVSGERLATAAEAAGVQAPADFRAIKAGALLVDHTYQRELMMTWVRTILADFSWAKLGALVVNRRVDGYQYVVSGQHRLAAIVEKFGMNQEVPCLVYEGMSVQQEARLYLSLDADRRAQVPHDLYRAKLASGDRAAHDVRKILGEFGMGLSMGWHDSADATRIRSVSTVQRLYASYGAERLRLVVGVLREGFGRSQAAFQQHMLSGVNQFFTRYNAQAEAEYLVAAMQKKGVDEIQRQGRQFMALPGIAGGLSRGVAVALQVAYNEVAPRPRRLPNYLAPMASARSPKARRVQVGGRVARVEVEG